MMLRMRTDLPAGRVTFLFTDVEGSTKLLDELGPERYADALGEHRRIVREAFTEHRGVEVDTQGDAFFVASPTAAGALAAAAAARDRLSSGPIRVRMGIHTGEPHLAAEGYVGVDVHRAARIGAAGHGGQIVVSAATAAEAGRNDLGELGEHRLKDFDQPVPLYQLGGGEFPPLKTISNTNLPRPASSFVGREREVAEITSLLRDGARLLTLTGPGGSGKTRLAIEAAATVVPDFKAGVFWVGLAALRDPALVVDEIALALGAKDGLREHIGERELLLLLDNLEQVVEYAVERLGESGEADEIRRRHVEGCVALAEEAEPHMRDGSTEWLDRIEAEHDNVRAALDWLEAAGDSQTGARLTAAVWHFWSLRGHLAEGVRRVDAALARDEHPSAVRARLLQGSADLALDTGYDETALHRAEEALALDRGLDNEQGVADCLFIIALSHTSFNRWQAAHDALVETIRRYRALGDERHVLMATRRLAWTYENLYGIDRATELHEENLLPGRRHPQQLACVRATARPAGRHAVALGDLLVDGDRSVREPGQVHRHEVAEPVAAAQRLG